MEDTAPASVDVTDPGIPGRAFARDSLERCRTSKKPEQSAESYRCPAHRLNLMQQLRLRLSTKTLALQRTNRTDPNSAQ
uniref:Uncharacterized protein n=1 Tax=Oryza sativa subsp. japonica TaxID=39947 RepID=Q10LU4_ORYSJ|nr:hypothetical protein LOC_Os03g21670 [Oryza sativa Japonica Group]